MNRTRFGEIPKAKRGKTQRARDAETEAIRLLKQKGIYPEPGLVYARIKTPPEVTARHLAWRILKEKYGIGCGAIAREAGDYNPAAVLNGINRSREKFREILV